MITPSAYWGSSNSDYNYYIPPISNMTCKKEQTKVTAPVAKILNPWQAYIKSNYDKVRSLPNKERFRALSDMYKNQ